MKQLPYGRPSDITGHRTTLFARDLYTPVLTLLMLSLRKRSLRRSLTRSQFFLALSVLLAILKRVCVLALHSHVICSHKQRYTSAWKICPRSHFDKPCSEGFFVLGMGEVGEDCVNVKRYVHH